MKARSLLLPIGLMTRCPAVVILLAGAVHAHAAGAPNLPIPYGVWRGTLGSQDVMVHLKPPGCESSYYYLRHLRGIPLNALGSEPGSWREGADPDAGPTWTFTRGDAALLEGRWTDAKDQSSLPVRLASVAASTNAEGDCDGAEARRADEAFNAPRVTALAPRTRNAAFDEHAYQVLEVPGTKLQALQIRDATRPVPRLNDQLRQWLKSEVAAYFDCQMRARTTDTGAPTRVNYTRRYAPVFWNAYVLVVSQTYSYHCGGPYPDDGTGEYLVWDLDTDQAMRPAQWFRVASRRPGEVDDGHLPPSLRALVARRYARTIGSSGDDACVGAVDRGASFEMYPTGKGMVFKPVLPHVIRTCEVETLVPWRELRPLLAPAGAAIVRDKIMEGGSK